MAIFDSSMTHTLRTTAKHWGIKLFASTTTIFLLSFSLNICLFFDSNDAEGRLWWVMGLVLYPALMIAGILPLLLNKIAIDDQTVSGRIYRDRFSMP